MIKLSIVIPVFNGSADLRRCLTALRNQVVNSEHVETIVVDDGSEEDIARIIDAFAPVRLVRSTGDGSYAARNRGIEAARGHILAFTDGDCVPSPEWLREGLKALEKAGTGVVAGRVEVFARDRSIRSPSEVYDLLTAFPQESYVRNDRFGVTANLFVERRVFDTVGRFNPHLKSGGDYEWGRRAFRHGFVVTYSETATVAHPARRSFSELKRKARRVCQGLEAIAAADATCDNRAAARIRWRRIPYGWIWRLLRDRSLGRLTTRLAAIGITLIMRSPLRRTRPDSLAGLALSSPSQPRFKTTVQTSTK